MKSKEEIRRYYINQRKSMNKEDVMQKSMQIYEKIIKCNQFIKTNIMMSYSSINNEVSTGLLNKYCIDNSKDLYLPVVIKENDNYKMIPVKVDKNTLYKTGYYGILEPEINNIADLEEVSLVIVPGVAFDNNKNRIGYGKGFYDKFLGQFSKNVYKIGIAYDFQITENLPNDINDIKMDIIVTEKRIIY